jgi:hypothetical protein
LSKHADPKNESVRFYHLIRRVYTSVDNAFKGEKKSGYDQGWNIRIRIVRFCFSRAAAGCSG